MATVTELFKNKATTSKLQSRGFSGLRWEVVSRLAGLLRKDETATTGVE